MVIYKAHALIFGRFYAIIKQIKGEVEIMKSFDKNQNKATAERSYVRAEHTPPEIVLECHSLPKDPDERKQVIEILKKKRDQILSKRSKK